MVHNFDRREIFHEPFKTRRLNLVPLVGLKRLT